MKVAFLYDGPHPMHLAWARSVGAFEVANRFNTRTDAAMLKDGRDREAAGKARGLDMVKNISLGSLGLPASSFSRGWCRARPG